MSDVSSLIALSWFITGRVPASACRASQSRRVPALLPGSRRLHPRRPALRQSLQIEDPADQVCLLLYAFLASTSESPQPVPVLGFAKQLFDELPTTLRQVVAGAACPHAHARVRRGATAWVDGDVGLDASLEDGGDKVLVKEALVGAKGRRAEPQPPARPVEQRQTAGLLRSHALKDLHAEPEQYPVAILHDGVDGVAGIGARPRAALRHVATVQVAQRAMRRIAPSFPAEV